MSDPEAESLCQLWLVLQNLETSEAGQLITFGPVEVVVCPHEANPTSALALCDLWCQIQEYKGTECVAACPAIYDQEVERELICSLWTELQLLSWSKETTPSVPGNFNSTAN
jgi:hypothetical protein